MIGYAQGRFDALHFGHVLMLERCKQYLGPGGKLVVGVATDKFCERWSNSPPQFNWLHRSTVIRALRAVDLVIPYSDEAAHEQYHQIRFDVMFASDEYRGTHGPLLNHRPFQTIWMPRIPGVSSSGGLEQ